MPCSRRGRRRRRTKGPHEQQIPSLDEPCPSAMRSATESRFQLIAAVAGVSPTQEFHTQEDIGDSQAASTQEVQHCCHSWRKKQDLQEERCSGPEVRGEVCAVQCDSISRREGVRVQPMQAASLGGMLHALHPRRPAARSCGAGCRTGRRVWSRCLRSHPRAVVASSSQRFQPHL